MSLRSFWQTCVAVLAIIQLVECVKLRIYCCNDTSLSTYKEVALKSAESLLEHEFYSSSKKNFFWVFGFTATVNGNGTTHVMGAMCRLRDMYNLFVLNWQEEAATIFSTGTVLDGLIDLVSYGVSAVPKAFEVADKFAKALVKMSKLGFSLNCTHLVGHSLGAQLAGKTARTVYETTGNQIGWLVGLDPAGPLFGDMSNSISSSDAKSVLCVLTDPGRYGTNKTICSINILVNYVAFTLPNATKRVQPSCPESNFYDAEGFCSHNIVWQLFIEALKSPKLTASKAANVWDWTRGLGNCSDTVSPTLHWDTTKSGLYFMNTTSSPPFGLGDVGACPTSSN